MGYPLRIIEPFITYHTFSRCIEIRDMMRLDKMKDLLVEVIKMAQEKYEFELMAYVILDNHFHFIIRTLYGEATISRIMQFIKAQYARRYNRMVKRTGPFWNERFGDTIIEHSEDPGILFNWINCYLGYNPVRKKSVNDPRDYKYSSINCYLDENYISPVKITYSKYFLELGSTFRERVKKFLEYEEMYRKRLFSKVIFDY